MRATCNLGLVAWLKEIFLCQGQLYMILCMNVFLRVMCSMVIIQCTCSLVPGYFSHGRAWHKAMVITHKNQTQWNFPKWTILIRNTCTLYPGSTEYYGNVHIAMWGTVYSIHHRRTVFTFQGHSILPNISYSHWNWVLHVALTMAERYTTVGKLQSTAGEFLQILVHTGTHTHTHTHTSIHTHTQGLIRINSCWFFRRVKSDKGNQPQG